MGYFQIKFKLKKPQRKINVCDQRRPLAFTFIK